jgi:FKBP-type peptidyl-prolyl cis-trans isomerase
LNRLTTLFMSLSLFGLLLLAACTPVPTPDPLPTVEGGETVEEVVVDVAEPTAVAQEEIVINPEDLAIPELPTQEEIDALLAELEIEVITPGDGPKPEPGDVVVTHVIVSTEDGTEVFNSYDIGEPIRFPQGIDVMFPVGLDVAVGQMSIGETARFTLPPAIGFGADGSGLVPPDSTVIMQVELTSIPKVEVIIEEEGDGPIAEMGDLLTVHYTGTLEDGTEFDSSRDRDPFQLILGMGQVIPGWEMGLEGLAQGTIARFIIPADLAYGSTDRPGIPANSTLIFEIELVTVEKPPAQE